MYARLEKISLLQKIPLLQEIPLYKRYRFIRDTAL